jgi:AcrR family transcriptional regulator
VDEAAGGTGLSAARRRLLDAADRLFYAHGVQAVGVDRLLAEARVTRVTFYRHFPAKEDLVEAYLRERMARGRRRVTEILERSPDDPRAALDEIARTFVEDSTVPGLRGCEFVNASAEYSHDSDPARALAVEQRQWIRDVTADLLGRLGHPRPTSWPRSSSCSAPAPSSRPVSTTPTAPSPDSCRPGTRSSTPRAEPRPTCSTGPPPPATIGSGRLPGGQARRSEC